MKSHFKPILVSTIIAIIAIFSIASTSCNRDKCKTIVCANGGVCNLGACICPAGYEGSNCETITRNKFLGTWEVFEKGSITNAAQYGVAVLPGAEITEVVITNFNNYFRSNIRGSVSGDTLFIPNQQYEGKLVFGIGTIYSGTTYGQYGGLTLEYEVIDTATSAVNDYGFNTVIDGSSPSQWNK